MPEKLLSVAEIARRLDVPESTLHYWKNRFSQYVPSVGRGRLKRFRPEAVEAFRTVAELMKSGHAAEDVMAALAQSYPVQGQPVSGTCQPTPADAEGAMEAAVRMAGAMGLEIARAIGEGLRGFLPGTGAPLALPDMAPLAQGLEQATSRLACHGEELDSLRGENAELKAKLSILEAELVRLRKDRREMEKFLLDKIKGVTS